MQIWKLSEEGLFLKPKEFFFQSTGFLEWEKYTLTRAWKCWLKGLRPILSSHSGEKKHGFLPFLAEDLMSVGMRSEESSFQNTDFPRFPLKIWVSAFSLISAAFSVSLCWSCGQAQTAEPQLSSQGLVEWEDSSYLRPDSREKQAPVLPASPALGKAAALSQWLTPEAWGPFTSSVLHALPAVRLRSPRAAFRGRPKLHHLTLPRTPLPGSFLRASLFHM